MEVVGITIKTKGGKKVELTTEEAKDLYKQLDAMFNKNVVYVPWQPIRYYEPYNPCWLTSDTFKTTTPNTLEVTYSCGSIA